MAIPSPEEDDWAWG